MHCCNRSKDKSLGRFSTYEGYNASNLNPPQGENFELSSKPKSYFLVENFETKPICEGFIDLMGNIRRLSVFLILKVYVSLVMLHPFLFPRKHVVWMKLRQVGI